MQIVASLNFQDWGQSTCFALNLNLVGKQSLSIQFFFFGENFSIHMLYTNLNIYSELANREYIYLNVPQNFRSKISIGARNGCPKTIRENVSKNAISRSIEDSNNSFKMTAIWGVQEKFGSCLQQNIISIPNSQNLHTWRHLQKDVFR